MKKTVNLRIPLGFTIENKIEYVDIDQAERYLLSKRARRYVKAIRNGADAELHSKWVICPYCGGRFVADTRTAMFGNPIKGEFSYVPKPTRAQIAKWASMQLTLFDDKHENEMLLGPSDIYPRSFICPSCEKESHNIGSKRAVSIELNSGKVIVKCEVIQIDEILCIEWVKTKELSISFPIFEVLTFDFNRGRVYVKIVDEQSRTLCQRDVTEYPEQLKNGATYKMLTQSKVVLRNVKRLFQSAWKIQLPYTGKHFDFISLFKMTMFVDYPKSFYDCIPYVQNALLVDKGFRSRARQIHNSKNLEKLYQKANLPQVKSIRRILYTNPGLFFYIEEIGALWNVFADHNLLSRFLISNRVFEILSAIHMRPGIIEYFCDCSNVKGSVYLLTQIDKNWRYVYRQAVDYCSMSLMMRKEIQKQWKHRNRFDFEEIALPSFSLPMCRPEESITDCTIGGYSFFWLRNSNDYAIASEQLQNCLDEWKPHNSPVVCVRKKNQYVAAIEVLKGRVVQARGYDNSSLENDPPLYEAFKKWMELFRLEWFDRHERLENDLGFFEYDDMPF